MKFIKSITIIFCVLMYTSVSSQNIDVVYNNRIDIDTLAIKNLPEATQANLKKLAKGELYILKVRGNKSYYGEASSDVFETIETKVIKDNGDESISKVVQHKYIEAVWKSHNEKMIKSQVNSNGTEYLIKDNFDDIQWTLVGDKKEISGIECNYATGILGNKYIGVWYAPSIPVNDGPGFTCNLPGLILEYKYGKRIIYATSINKNVTNLTLPEFPVGTFTTRATYEEIMQNTKTSLKSGTTKNGNTTTTVTRH